MKRITLISIRCILFGFVLSLPLFPEQKMTGKEYQHQSSSAQKKIELIHAELLICENKNDSL